jgi:urease accessory protein
VDLVQLEADATTARQKRPFVMAALKSGKGVPDIVRFIVEDGGL